MTTSLPDPAEGITYTEEDPAASPRTRRAVMAGLLGGLGAWAAAAIVKVAPSKASAGSALIIGSEVNNAGSANTQLITNSNTVAFKLLQNGANTALMGYATTTANSGGPRGVYGRVDSPNGDGVQGRNAGSAGTGAAMRAFGGNNPGLVATSAVNAVLGTSTGLTGVYGTGPSAGLQGQGGIYGSFASGASVGAYGTGADYGLYGAGGTYGCYAAGSSYGVYGAGAVGVVGISSDVNSDAVRGDGGQYGVRGINARTAGTRGDSGYVGAWGQATSYGVYGLATDGTNTSYGVFGQASNGASYGVWCQGNMHVAGTLSKTAGAFKIDHPLDPEQRWLSHSFVESPDMMNVYNGNATLDGTGKATVTLPDYFEALNVGFRYQLTPIGAPAPSLHVASEIQANSFRIAGGASGQKVSWQVTGVRQDDYAKAHPIVVETPKGTSERGTRQFVPGGSSARLMKVGPAQPAGPQAATQIPVEIKPLPVVR